MKRKLKLLEYRRLQGARMLMKGISKAEVARQLGVSRQSVQNWAVRLRLERKIQFGRWVASSFQYEQAEFLANKKVYKTSYEKLRSQKLGRPQMLSKQALLGLKRLLKAGAKQAGHKTDKWTLAKVQDWIQKECLYDESISRTQVLRIMQALGFSCEKPSLDDQARLRKWEGLGWIEV